MWIHPSDDQENVSDLQSLDMHPLAAASRSRLLETEPKLFGFKTSYDAFCRRYCFECRFAKVNVNTVKQHLLYHILIDNALIRID